MAITLDNEFTVDLPIEETWRLLLDLGEVATCLPGATVEPGEDGAVNGRMRVSLGAMTMTYKGSARIAEEDDQRHVAVFEVEGKETRGGGSASARIHNELINQGAFTRVSVRTELSVTGRPAQFGRGIMQDVAGAMLRDFADCLSQKLAGAPAVTATSAQPPAASPAEGAPSEQPSASARDELDLTPAVRSVMAKRVAPLLGALTAVLVLVAWRRRRARCRR